MLRLAVMTLPHVYTAPAPAVLSIIVAIEPPWAYLAENLNKIKMKMLTIVKRKKRLSKSLWLT